MRHDENLIFDVDSASFPIALMLNNCIMYRIYIYNYDFTQTYTKLKIYNTRHQNILRVYGKANTTIYWKKKNMYRIYIEHI